MGRSLPVTREVLVARGNIPSLSTCEIQLLLKHSGLACLCHGAWRAAPQAGPQSLGWLCWRLRHREARCWRDRGPQILLSFFPVVAGCLARARQAHTKLADEALGSRTAVSMSPSRRFAERDGSALPLWVRLLGLCCEAAAGAHAGPSGPAGRVVTAPASTGHTARGRAASRGMLRGLPGAISTGPNTSLVPRSPRAELVVHRKRKPRAEEKVQEPKPRFSFLLSLARSEGGTPRRRTFVARHLYGAVSK